MIIAFLFGHGTYVKLIWMPDLMRNILMQLLKSLFKRELERQSADHFQQCLMAITTSKIENE